MAVFCFILKLVFASFLFLYLGGSWLTYKSYEFRVAEVKQVAQSWCGNFAPGKISPAGVRQNFAKRHKAVNETAFSSLMLRTGGLRGCIHLIYGSLTEFLAVYHAPFGTSGDTGRHFMNMSVSVLQGQVKVWNNNRGLSVYEARSHYTYRIGERSYVEMDDDTYLLIYGRGILPLTMGYWISDALFSTLDPSSALLTLMYYIRAVFWSSNITAYFGALYDTVWKLAAGGVDYVVQVSGNAIRWFAESVENVLQNGKQILADA